jgi:hypothetical protein
MIKWGLFVLCTPLAHYVDRSVVGMKCLRSCKKWYNGGSKYAEKYFSVPLVIRTNEAQLALISSYADLYHEPTQEEDEELLREIAINQPEEGVILMELMPAWKRWGYEEGIEKGIVEGLESGKRAIALNLLTKGMSVPEVSEVTKLAEEVVLELQKSLEH